MIFDMDYRPEDLDLAAFDPIEILEPAIFGADEAKNQFAESRNTASQEPVSMMELRHLRSFLVVAEELNFNRASRRLYLSQPGLTAQIQRLESDLGVPLFVRGSRTALTVAGTLLVEEAKQTLARAATARERVLRASRGEIGRLRIGFVSTAALEIVPSFTYEFRRRFPGITLDLIRRATNCQVNDLLTGNLDVGFVRLPVEKEELTLAKIHSEPFVVILREGHPLATKDNFSLKSLTNSDLVAYERAGAPGFFDSILKGCRNAGFTPKNIHEVRNMSTAVALVAAGEGVAIVPRSVALAQAKGITVRPVPEIAHASEIAIAKRTSANSAVGDAFYEFATQPQRLANGMTLRTTS